MTNDDKEAPGLPGLGAQLLDQLHDALTRYVILPSPEAADAVTLWIAATHAQKAWEHATRLAIISPEKRCGKSRLLDVVEATSHTSLITVNISSAALVRSIGDDPPTLLLDEADTVFGAKSADGHEDLRGILNAGHQRNRPYIRWDAAARRRETCPTFAMAALAGIGDLPDTIMDRAVIVRMRRRTPSEKVRPYRQRRDARPLVDLGGQLAKWAKEHLDELLNAEPDMPVEDRAADTWESLIAIADAAGGSWPERARTACRTLVNAAEDDTTVGVRLLADLRTVFDGAEALHGVTILEHLHAIEEAPWADWYGRALTARDLAKLLKPFGIRSTKVKIGGTALQGYRRADLYDAWTRYLPPLPEPVEPAEPPSSEGMSAVPVPDAQTEPEPEPPLLTCEVPQVLEVPDTPGEVDAVVDRDALFDAVEDAVYELDATGAGHLLPADVAEVLAAPTAELAEVFARQSGDGPLDRMVTAVRHLLTAAAPVLDRDDLPERAYAALAALKAAAQDPAGRCAACGEPMTVTEPDQTTHPTCTQEDIP